jgi:hypothetical protein
MADSNVPITAGSGTNIDTYQITGGDHQQVVREARGTAESDNSWTVSTTASTSQVAADASRVGVMIVSAASARVYLRFDATAPTSTAYHYFLDPGDRWEVPYWLSTFAISMLGASAGGTILTHLTTAA